MTPKDGPLTIAVTSASSQPPLLGAGPLRKDVTINAGAGGSAPECADYFCVGLAQARDLSPDLDIGVRAIYLRALQVRVLIVSDSKSTREASAHSDSLLFV